MVFGIILILLTPGMVESTDGMVEPTDGMVETTDAMGNIYQQQFDEIL